MNESAPGLLRHRGRDRALHWLMAAAVLTLLATSLLPKLGVTFEWLTIHWVTGICLILFILGHLTSALLRRSAHHIWIGLVEVSGFLAEVRTEIEGASRSKPAAGKYSFPQKLFHLGVTSLVLLAAITGIAMLVRIDTPFWTRDPYWLSATAWGVVYVLHDLAALLVIPALMLHIYFALRPEKRHFTRSMLLGWISEEEYRKYHDPALWTPAALQRKETGS